MSRRVTFLTAKQPLTKTFYASGDVEPYPLAKDFSSLTLEYNTINDLFEAMELAGSTGATMLKGHLSKSIKEESRAGLTDPNADTDLLVIDYDSDGGFESIDQLLYEIDPSLPEVDYIFQHSASSGVNGKSGLRGHVFVLLDTPVSPNVLKQWLKKINLTSEKFKSRIKLSRNAMALCYALDISVVQNDKLIYIAKPIFVGMKDPMEKRFELHIRDNRTYTFTASVSTDSNKSKELKLLSDLRNRSGLEARTPKYKSIGDHEILLNPATCIISGIKDCGDYVRVNLNGGDSFAYWYHKNSPELLHNFKGEPAVFLRDIAPDYWERMQQEIRADSLRPFVFRDWVTDTYFNAEYNEDAGRLAGCYATRRNALSDFMLQRGKPAPRVIEDWNVFFDPTKNEVVDFKHKTLNLFTATDYLKCEIADPKARFPIIERVLRHICVDNPTYEHFIKWLAHIVKFRTKTQTAWLFSGTEGCLSGDTEIGLTRGKRNAVADRPRTIKDIYQKWSGVCEETRIGSGNGFKPFNRSITPTKVMSCKDNLSVGLHEVYDIYESGVRPLWRLTTNTGRSIKATKEHPFMRSDKSMTPMGQLNIGDSILVQGDRLLDKSERGRKKNRVTVHSIPHHPTAWQHMVNGKDYKRNHKARLVYEAELNGISYDEFIRIIKTDPVTANQLLYLTKEEIIHHLDEDVTNDDISNLVVISKQNHDQHHAKETGLGTHPAIEEIVTSIEYVGEEMTYDMTMKAPYHNYVANGFIVSNTGKGTLFHQILKPILGKEQTFMIVQDQAEDQFNGYLRQNMLLFLDEGDIESSKQAERMLAKFRSIITEPNVPVRMMRAAPVNVDNYTNLIIATNKSLAIKLTEGDRRYNVAPRQNNKLDINVEEYELIPTELMAFTNYLRGQDVQPGDAIKIIQTQARRDIIELSRTIADDFFDALGDGDLDFFAELLVENPPINNAIYITYARTIIDWMKNTGVPLEVDVRTILDVYRHVSGNDDMTDKRFGHLSKRKGLLLERKRIKGILRRVVTLNFLKKDYTDWLDRDVKSAIEQFTADIKGGEYGLQKTKDATETKKIN